MKALSGTRGERNLHATLPEFSAGRIVAFGCREQRDLRVLAERQAEADGRADGRLEHDALRRVRRRPGQRRAARRVDVHDDVVVVLGGQFEVVRPVDVVEPVFISVREGREIRRVLPEIDDPVFVFVWLDGCEIRLDNRIHAVADFEAIVEAVSVGVRRARIGLALEFLQVGQPVFVAVDAAVRNLPVPVSPLLPEVGDAVAVRVGRVVRPPGREK